jgi:hypothetical protein
MITSAEICLRKYLSTRQKQATLIWFRPLALARIYVPAPSREDSRTMGPGPGLYTPPGACLS